MKNVKRSAVIVPLLSTLALTPATYAKSFNDYCPNIKECAESMSKLTNKQYIFAQDIMDHKISATEGLNVHKQNADDLFSIYLAQNDLARLPISGEKNTFIITHMRNVKFYPKKIYNADFKTTPSFPTAWDFGQLHYKLKNPKIGKYILRETRHLTSRHGRVVHNRLSGEVMVVDLIPNLKAVLGQIRKADQKLSPKIMEQWDKEKRRKEKQQAAVASKAK